LGGWKKLKGVDLLPRIMNDLGNEYQLFYTGDKPLTIDGKILSNTHALGQLRSGHEVAKACRNADVLIFPSRVEGFGLVAVEAQACGLPVIATRCSSLPEVVEEGTTGLLCPSDDVEAFSAAARRLAENPRQWLAMSRAARTRVESHFDIDTMIDRYIDIYRATLQDSN